MDVRFSHSWMSGFPIEFKDMKSSKRRDEISDSYYVSQTISALFGLLGLAYILSDVTIWVVGVENKQIKWILIFIYNVLITFMPHTYDL